MRVISAAALVLLLAVLVPRAAEPCVAVGSVPNYSDTNQNNNTTGRIYYFVESDMAAELRGATPSTADDALTETHIRHTIKSTAGIWNNNARGQTLVYGGSLSTDVATAACSSTSLRPAIFIHFDDCKGGTDTCDDPNGNNSAEVSSISGCPKMAQITFYEENDSGNNYAWDMGSQGTSFENALLHEFGHTLELGHSTDESVPLCDSVMGVGCTQGGRFPMTWDRDCADFYQNPRNARYRWAAWSSTGTYQGVTTDSLWTDRPFASGGWIERPLNDVKYPLWRDSSISVTDVTTNGVLFFASSYQAPSIAGGHETPVIFRPPEMGTGKGTVINYLDDNTPYVPFDPPRANFRRSDDLQSWSGALYRECESVSACSSPSTLTTYLPLTTAYDPVSARTAFVSIRTESVSGSDGIGEIRVHPGAYSHSTSIDLRRGWPLDISGMTVPSTGTSWAYVGRTNHLAATACADAAFGITYNCILAWTDLGDRSTGYVLYTYYKINPPTILRSYPTVTYSGTVYARGGSNTVNPPTAAFFADRFWLGWLKATFPARVSYVANTSGYTGWGTTSELTEQEIAGPPTFLYKDGYESALAWTFTEN